MHRESGTLHLEEALNPFRLTTIVQHNISQIKQELIDSYRTIKRADEELNMVAVEINNTVEYYEHEVKVVRSCIEVMNSKWMHSVLELWHYCWLIL